MRWNRITLSLFAFGLFLVLFLSLYIPLRPSGQVLREGWEAEYQGIHTSNVSLPYIHPSSATAEPLTLTTTLTTLEGDSLILRPGSYAFTVSLNGQQIAGVGDMDEPTANVWNSIQLIPLTNLRPGSNTLQIKLSSANRFVGMGTPPYIDDFKASRDRITFINWLSNDFLLLNQGAGFIVGILLISIARSRVKLYGAEFYMGIAAILGSIYVFDFNMRASTGGLVELLLVRKICLISGYLGALLFVYSLEMYYYSQLKYSKLIALPSLFAILVLAVQPTQYQFSVVLIYTNLVLVINLVTASIFIFRNHHIKEWLIVPAILLTLSILETIFVMVFMPPWPFMTQYIGLFSSVFFGVNLILEFHQLYHENIELQVKSNVDPLTGTFNRNILKESMVRQFNTLALIDLDNFKSYNDHHGHAAGDQLLLLFVDTVRRNIRQNDLVIRFGGDEFLLMLNHNTPGQADEILERISAQFSKLVPGERVHLSYGIDSMRESLDASIKTADQRMYEMKTSHKSEQGSAG